MDVLEQLRSDMQDAGDEAECMSEGITAACLEILDEFIGGYEVVETAVGSGGRAYYRYASDYPRLPAQTIIVPRKPEPRITDHTLTERMAALEDELKHRCGNLGRRVNALEFKRRRLLEAAEEVFAAFADMTPLVCNEAWHRMERARAALTAAIKEERER